MKKNSRKHNAVVNIKNNTVISKSCILCAEKNFFINKSSLILMYSTFLMYHDDSVDSRKKENFNNILTESVTRLLKYMIKYMKIHKNQITGQ